eukprot:scaffold56389_cov75-Cyclotella_meneghiniana.AAC.13
MDTSPWTRRNKSAVMVRLPYVRAAKNLRALGRAPPYSTVLAPVISALLSQCCELLRPVKNPRNPMEPALNPVPFTRLILTHHRSEMDTSPLCVPKPSTDTHRKFRAFGFRLKEIFVRHQKWNALFELKCV